MVFVSLIPGTLSRHKQDIRLVCASICELGRCFLWVFLTLISTAAMLLFWGGTIAYITPNKRSQTDGLSEKKANPGRFGSCYPHLEPVATKSGIA